jgi:hypothetical protein
MHDQSWNMGAANTNGDPHQATLRVAFDKYDVDKDGYISFVDLRTRFRDLGRLNVPDVEIRRWIADKGKPFVSTVFYTVLRCSTLFYAVLRCSTLFYAVLRCSTLFYTVLHCSTLFYAVLRCSTPFLL